MTLQTILLTAHSWIRWLALLAAAAALIRYVLGWLQGHEFDGLARGLMAAYSGLLDLNALIGLIQLIAFWGDYSAIAGGFPRTQIEHFTTLLIAVIVAHLPARLWQDKPAAVRYRNGALAILASLVLIIVGITVLAGNRWVFRGL